MRTVELKFSDMKMSFTTSTEQPLALNGEYDDYKLTGAISGTVLESMLLYKLVVLV